MAKIIDYLTIKIDVDSKVLALMKELNDRLKKLTIITKEIIKNDKRLR